MSVLDAAVKERSSVIEDSVKRAETEGLVEVERFEKEKKAERENIVASAKGKVESCAEKAVKYIKSI